MAERTSLGRAWAAALLLQLGFAPLAAHALGLGTLRVNSALGQPLSATIELVGATPAEAELATIRLAPAEVYQRLGVEGAGTMLRFTVQVGNDGRPYVRVTSAEAIREPYVDFVVEAVSSIGQVVRHYTVLLDPAGSAPPAQPPLAAWSPPVTPTPQRAPARSRPDRFDGVGAPVAGTSFGPVPSGATLWAIARRVQPPAVGLDAVMSAIVRANPHAFIQGNPDRLKAGSRLAIPNEQALREASTVEASKIETPPPEPAQPIAPDAAPAAVPSVPPASAPEATGPIESAPATAAPSAEVRVVRAEDADPAATSGGVQQAAASDNRIHLLEEALDVSQQQNESLQQRLGALEEQIKTLTELIKDAPSGSEPGGEQNTAATSGAPASAQSQGPPPAAVEAATAPLPSPADAPRTEGKMAYLAAGVGALVLGVWLWWTRGRRNAAQSLAPVVTDTAMQEDLDAPAPGSIAPRASLPGASVEWVEAVPPPVPPPNNDLLPADDVADDVLGDPVDSQIDLLAAYVGMADGASARQIYDEIVRAGNVTQKAQAAELIAKLDG